MLARGRAGKIRAPRRGLNQGDVDFESTWNTIATAFTQIFGKSASGLSFEELFRQCYKLVLKKKADLLYDRVIKLEQVWLRENIRTKILSLVNPSITVGLVDQTTVGDSNERRIAGERFARALKDAFNHHTLSMGMITDVMMYMDKYLSHDGGKPSIYAASMSTFRLEILKAPFSEDATLDTLSLLETVLLDMIRMERKGEVIDRSLVRQCCYMLEGLYESFTEEETTKLYLTSFEPKFLEASRQFYKSEGQALLAEADASTFCTHARRRLSEEEERCKQTISQTTEQKIKSVVEQELIQAHMREVINMEGTGVKNMLDNDKIQDLANVYDLIARVDQRKGALRDALQKRVIEQGSDINKAANVISEAQPAAKPPQRPADGKAPAEKSLSQQTQAAINWVEQVLELRNKYDRFWVEAFRKDVVMEKALEVSFQDFINANDQSPEHLSLFLDEYLKRGGKDKTDAEVDAILDNGILLLQYLANKDIFERYYKRHMAKRLLMKKSVSREMERLMLSKMKMKIGNQFTQKLEALIRDTELSDNLSAQYKTYVNSLGDPDPKRVELDCRVLTSTTWPFETIRKDDDDDSRKRPTIKWPSTVDQVRQRFEQFYLDKHTGRRLEWVPNLGDADIRATFTNNGKTRRYELNVSTYAMVILMLFNDLPSGECLTCEQIQAETNIPQADLVRNLQSLSLVAKWRVLKKDPPHKEVKPSDKFSFNEGFSSQYLKIKVSVVSGGGNRVENSEERRATQKKTDEERGHVIDAAIVRIMKSRKNLSHSQLMTETLAQLSARFKPDVNMIKKRIESLMDREFLERGPDPTQPSYVYMA
ncbi:hypothetical protein PV08_10129 [Exophiala spinifera]|uniref:Cullin family profile domain-containing protein n=1 Tax=Exophiala spinifera TaxID=91928 RepID=A0A0D2AWG2_9EURO|nr:uncharacterized protein PV08_10129 [Exophiala spinifera]KIW10830.1 hypothetical protein PV08_10129 [Exophiala spinifera]